jgi:hypothetical protein
MLLRIVLMTANATRLAIKDTLQEWEEQAAHEKRLKTDSAYREAHLEKLRKLEEKRLKRIHQEKTQGPIYQMYLIGLVSSMVLGILALMEVAIIKQI